MRSDFSPILTKFYVMALLYLASSLFLSPKNGERQLGGCSDTVEFLHLCGTWRSPVTSYRQNLPTPHSISPDTSFQLPERLKPTTFALAAEFCWLKRNLTSLVLICFMWDIGNLNLVITQNWTDNKLGFPHYNTKQAKKMSDISNTIISQASEEYVSIGEHFKIPIMNFIRFCTPTA